MNHWIDRIVLWIFVAFSAYVLMMSLTDQSLLIALPSAFLLVLLIRSALLRLTDKKWISRKKRLQYAASLVRDWTFPTEREAIDAIKALLPGTFKDDATLCLHQALSDDGGLLTADHLLNIWKTHREKDHLRILSTCPASDKAFSLCAELNRPSIELVDSKRLTAMIAKEIRCVPAADIKKQRRRSFRDRAARYIHSIRPVRAGIYGALCLTMYFFANSVFYLIIAAAEALIILIHIFFLSEERIRRSH